MYLRTELTLPPSESRITHAGSILSLGSCFADRMGHRLLSGGFRVHSNPFGVIFHPLPMLHALRRAQEGQQPDPASLVQKDGHWVSLEAHSVLAAPSSPALLQQWDATAAATRHALASSQVLLLTFGTARGYFHPPTDRIAANCHKQPASAFHPRMSSVEEMAAPWIAFLNSLPHRPLTVLTVSPVRHVRDTLPVNSLSKALLRVMCDAIVSACEHAVYFPAWELLMDDLRDYRFYAEDLIHPSPLAEGYIWDKFCETFMSTETRDLIRRREHLLRDLAHRPLHTDTEAHQRFLQQLQAKATALDGKVEMADVWEEIRRRGREGAS